MFQRTKWATPFRRIEIVLCVVCIVLGGIIIYNISSIFWPIVVAGIIFLICCILYIWRQKYEDESIFTFDVWVIIACFAGGIFFLLSGYLYTASVFYEFPLILIFAHVAITTTAVVFLLDLIFTIWSEIPQYKSIEVEDSTIQLRRPITSSHSGIALQRYSNQHQLQWRSDQEIEPAADLTYKCDRCLRRREELFYLCQDEICPDKIDKSTQFEKEYLPDEFCRRECETCDDKNICDKMECYEDAFTILKEDKTTQFNSESNPYDRECSHENLLAPKPNEMCILECESIFKNLPNLGTKATQITTLILQPNTCDSNYCYPKFGQTVATQCSLDNLERKYSDSTLTIERVISTTTPKRFGKCNKVHPLPNRDKQTQVSNIKECKNKRCGVESAATSERYTETIGDQSLLGLFYIHPERRGAMDNATQISKTEVPAKTTRSEITQTSFDKIIHVLPTFSHREIQTSSHLLQRQMNDNRIRINPEKNPVTIVVEYDSVSDSEKVLEEYDYSLPNSYKRCEDICKENYHPDEQCPHRCCRCYTPRRKRVGIKVGQCKENETKKLDTHSSIDCQKRHCGMEHDVNQQPYANKSRRNGLDTPLDGNKTRRSLNQDSPVVRQASPLFRFVTPNNSRNSSPQNMENTSPIMENICQKKLPASDPNSITFNR